MSNVFLLRIESPIGRIELVGDDDHLVALTIEDADGLLPHDGEPERPNPILEQARDQLAEYFAGTRTDFDVPVQPAGGSEFQRAVWSELSRLHWGEATSYGARRRHRQARLGTRDRRCCGSEPDPDHHRMPSGARIRRPGHGLLGREGRVDEALAARSRADRIRRVSSTRPDLVVGDDGLTRCAWGAGDAEYSRYHDEEWGTPMHDPCDCSRSSAWKDSRPGSPGSRS